MKRDIKKIAVIGSGVMGSRIACHFANIGVEVLLLDIAPTELSDVEKAKGLSLEDNKVRKRIVDSSLQTAITSKPSPLYLKSSSRLISTGTIDDDLTKIADCDWIIEAVIERLDIKLQLFEKIGKLRKAGSIVSSNTSGIPIHMMSEGMDVDLKKHFCGTHFFNPPRYLELLEIIPSPDTDIEILDFLMHYGHKNLGKTTVLCKDAPAFIANRVGVYSIMAIFHLMSELDLSVSEIDLLTGPTTGRPKSATFRTCDVVGIDTLVKVANDLKANCPDDEQNHLFDVPDYVLKLVENGWTGDKGGQGFYKKTKNEKGKTEIHELNVSDFTYGPKQKIKVPGFSEIKGMDSLIQRLKAVQKLAGKYGEFYNRFYKGLFSYVSFRIPEISEDLYKIDDALRAGFGWDIGPFEHWDGIGVEKMLLQMEESEVAVAPWVHEMIKNGCTSFYKGKNQFYDISSGAYKDIPGRKDLILLDNYRSSNIVWQNSGTTLLDLGDGILNLEFHTKMNSMGSEVIEGINKAIEIVEKDHQGLVIANEGANFSAGANLGLVFMLALEQDYDEINFAIKAFQDTMMGVKYSRVPIVVAPHGLALGGACELCMHAPFVQAHAETYMGLVEVGVGVIPAGGGTKELAARASKSYYDGDPTIPNLQNYFLTAAQAKVSTSAHEAFDLKYLTPGVDRVSVNKYRRVKDSKERLLEAISVGYQAAARGEKIKVLGRGALGAFYTGANAFVTAKYMSEHDRLVTNKLAYVICGGDLSSATEVSEEYLLDLEREAFLSLLGEKKTLERIQSILTSGKPLRN